MKAYYQDDAVTIYHGDCRDIAPEIPRESVDLLLTDPPYGMAFVSGWTAAKLTVKQAGRRAVGIELDESLCAVAAGRCSQDVLAVA